MAASERSLEILANTIARTLLEKELVSGIDESDLRALAVRVLLDDRAAELAIDDAAKTLMRRHAAEISRGNMDTGELFRKFRAQIAKERGFTL